MRTNDPRAAQFPLGDLKLASTVSYLGIEAYGALEVSEKAGN
jgi:hypothetical protein